MRRWLEGVNIALHKLPIWWHALRVGGWGGRRFSSFHSKEEVAIMSSGKRILFIKKEGRSRWGGETGSWRLSQEEIV